MDNIDINDVLIDIQNKVRNGHEIVKEGVIVVDSIDDFNRQMNAIPLDELDSFFCM